VEAYREMGYLPEALRNYLLRLGWSHGDDEIISESEMIAWFNLEGIGKSPSRFDFAKLDNLNAHYIRESDNARLAGLILPLLAPKLALPDNALALLTHAMNGLKQRAKTLNELAENALFYVTPRPIPLTEKAGAALDRELLTKLYGVLEGCTEWNEAALQNLAKHYAESTGIKLGVIAQPLRIALSGSTISPSVFDIMQVLGREESLARIKDLL